MKKSILRHLGAVPFELFMVGGAIVTFTQGNWLHFTASVFTLLVSFAPLAVERLFRIKLPAEVHISYVAFIFLSMFSGEVLKMYAQFAWWDDFTHFISGILIGLGAMLLLSAVIRKKNGVRAPLWFEVLFIFLMAVTVASLWEIAEFISDERFGTFSQGGDLFDTMMDLVYQMVAGLIMAVAWAFHRRGKYVWLVSLWINRFEALNPKA